MEWREPKLSNQGGVEGFVESKVIDLPVFHEENPMGWIF